MNNVRLSINSLIQLKSFVRVLSEKRSILHTNPLMDFVRQYSILLINNNLQRSIITQIE